jgi:hypothetical protein
MVDQLIPRLEHLCFKNSFNISAGFVERFVKQHNEDWQLAEEHWENIVGRILNTDAVDVNASRKRAVHQAVAAAITLLEETLLRERCPICPRERKNRLQRNLLRRWRRST